MASYTDAEIFNSKSVEMERQIPLLRNRKTQRQTYSVNVRVPVGFPLVVVMLLRITDKICPMSNCET